MTLTVAHLARIAFIRSIYRSAIKVSTDGKVDQAFWRTVDTTLRAVREEKQNDAARISRRVSQTDHITVFLLTQYAPVIWLGISSRIARRTVMSSMLCPPLLNPSMARLMQFDTYTHLRYTNHSIITLILMIFYHSFTSCKYFSR